MSTIEVKRKKGESFEAFFRRAQARLRQSGKQQEIRSGRFFVPAPNKNKQRDSALRRLTKGARREYLLKTGKAKEEDFRKKTRRH